MGNYLQLSDSQIHAVRMWLYIEMSMMKMPNSVKPKIKMAYQIKTTKAKKIVDSHIQKLNDMLRRSEFGYMWKTVGF